MNVALLLIAFDILGQDQTVVEVMSLEEHELLKEEMLALLGMTYAPDHSVHKIDIRSLGNKTVKHAVD